MKQILFSISLIVSLNVFASNYPSDYCNANVQVCEDGPAVAAFISSACNSPAYVIGYKKQGALGNNSFVDAVVQNNFSNNSVQSVIRITPDWHNLGFLTSENFIYTIDNSGVYGYLNSLSVAYSDGKGSWDSKNKNGKNYNFQIGHNANGCYTVKTNDVFTSNKVPLAVWNLINQAMSRQ